MKPPLIVFGTHRSGTSLLMELLTMAGAFGGAMPDRNRESMPVLSCNEALFRTASASWDEPRLFSDYLRADGNYAPLLDQLRREWGNAAVQRQFWGETPAHSSVWAIKDPRFAFTLPLWLELYPDAKLVVISRHGVDVARSLHLRHQQIMLMFQMRHPEVQLGETSRFMTGLVEHRMRCHTPEGALALWAEYESQLQWVLGRMPQPRHILRYESLVEHPAEEVARLLDFAGLPVTAPQIQALARVPVAKRPRPTAQDAYWQSLADENRDWLEQWRLAG